MVTPKEPNKPKDGRRNRKDYREVLRDWYSEQINPSGDPEEQRSTVGDEERQRSDDAPAKSRSSAPIPISDGKTPRSRKAFPSEDNEDGNKSA